MASGPPTCINLTVIGPKSDSHELNLSSIYFLKLACGNTVYDFFSITVFQIFKKIQLSE